MNVSGRFIGVIVCYTTISNAVRAVESAFAPRVRSYAAVHAGLTQAYCVAGAAPVRTEFRDVRTCAQRGASSARDGRPLCGRAGRARRRAVPRRLGQGSVRGGSLERRVWIMIPICTGTPYLHLRSTPPADSNRSPKDLPAYYDPRLINRHSGLSS